MFGVLSMMSGKTFRKGLNDAMLVGGICSYYEELPHPMSSRAKSGPAVQGQRKAEEEAKAESPQDKKP